MKLIFHVDPLICPCCHEEMIPVYYVFNGKTVYDPPRRKRRKRRKHEIINPKAFAYKEDFDVKFGTIFCIECKVRWYFL